MVGIEDELSNGEIIWYVRTRPVQRLECCHCRQCQQDTIRTEMVDVGMKGKGELGTHGDEVGCIFGRTDLGSSARKFNAWMLYLENRYRSTLCFAQRPRPSRDACRR